MEKSCQGTCGVGASRESCFTFVVDRTARQSVWYACLPRKQWPYGRHTEEGDLVPSAIVLHEELVSSHYVLVEVPGGGPVLV